MAKDDTPKALLEALDLIRDTGGPKLESLENVESRHLERVRAIFEDRTIVAIGISEKETESEPTGHLGLTFYVEKKLPKSRMQASKMVPPVISVPGRTAVFTDVKEIGKIVPQVNRKLKPIESGFSIGNKKETGTLGAIVKKRSSFYLLSNSHVLANSGKGKPGDPIFYPGDFDRGDDPRQKVAELAEIFPFEKSASFVNRVDAALAAIDKDFAKELDFSIFHAKTPLQTTTAKRGMKVVIRGRTSGIATGEVVDVHFSTQINYPGVGKLGFIDQVLCTRYTQGGDSGSLVVDEESGKLVGLHIAGSPDGSIFNPITEVVKALKFRFVT